MSDNKKQELDLFHKWKSTGDAKHFQALYSSMKPLIYDAARKASYGSNLPESAHRIWAAQSFHDALATFKPTAGASLQTHVYGAVHQKAKRLNYQYQDIAHKPEPRATQVGLFQSEHANLKEELQREPTPAELAARLNWPVKDVERLKREIHSDLAMDEGTEEYGVFESHEGEEVLEYLYHELPLEEKKVYDMVLGKHGQPKMSKANGRVDFDRIARASGFSTSKARMLYNSIKAKFEKAARR